MYKYVQIKKSVQIKKRINIKNIKLLSYEVN